MRTYYTRDCYTGRLCAMVNARTYAEALKKTCGLDPSFICRHTRSHCLETPSGFKVSNYVTFIYGGQLYYMYHL